MISAKSPAIPHNPIVECAPPNLWKECFLASLTGYIANQYTTESEGIPCDEIAQWASNQADEAVALIERRWPVKKAQRVPEFATERRRAKKRVSARSTWRKK